MNETRFDGRIAVVTGASSGIGRAVVAQLAKEGANIVLIGRDENALLQVLTDFGLNPQRHLTLTKDLLDDEAASEIVSSVISRFGRLDVLINAAGVIGSGSIVDTLIAGWDEMMRLNLRVVFQLIQESIPYMESSKGCVVNVSSVAGPRAFPNLLSYCVSKAGLDQLTRRVALDLALWGIRVDGVNPGVVRTNLHLRGGMDSETYQSFLEHSKTTHPLGRIGQPEEIAALVCFLASEDAAWITGETVSIDGGRFLTCLR